MKRLLPVLVLTLVLVQLVMLPTIVNAGYWIGTPSVTTLPPTNVTPYSAILNASVTYQMMSTKNSGSLRPVSDTSEYYSTIAPTASGYFRYGTSSGALTSSTTPISIPYAATTFASDILGLIPCTTYYAQAFVIAAADPIDYQLAPSDYMIALFSHGADLTGLGTGLNQLMLRNINVNGHTTTFGGNIISFTTPGCVINTGSHNAGSGTGSNNGAVGISNITVNAAAISASKVGPGEKVDITATVTNKGTVNGATSIALYINGQQVESKGITLAAGQSEPMHFFVSQNEPGTYSVQVGGVSAGSYTVDAFSNNEILIYGIIALFTIGIAGTIFMLARKRQA